MRRPKIRHAEFAAARVSVRLLTGAALQHIPATPIVSVNTTAAANVFASALAVYWHNSTTYVKPCDLPTTLGTITTTRHGSEPNLAIRKEIETLRNSS